MSALKNRVAAIEEKLPANDSGPLFIYREIVSPGKEGPVKCESPYRRVKLHDGRTLLGEPGETEESFEQRILNTDTAAKSGGCYRILCDDKGMN